MSSDELDIKTLLETALDDDPPDDLPDRITARIAAVKTTIEFARLIGIAPIDSWLYLDRNAEDAEDLDDEESDDR